MLMKSKKPGKQRHYRYNMPLHRIQKTMKSHLSKELRKKLKTRAVGIRKGDEVIIMVGKFKKKKGKVRKVDYKKRKVYIEGFTIKKVGGKETFIPFDPSNLMIITLGSEDERRFKRKEIKEEIVVKDKKEGQKKNRVVKKSVKHREEKGKYGKKGREKK